MRQETELKICQTELEETKTQLKLQLKYVQSFLRATQIKNKHVFVSLEPAVPFFI